MGYLSISVFREPSEWSVNTLFNQGMYKFSIGTCQQELAYVPCGKGARFQSKNEKIVCRRTEGKKRERVRRGHEHERQGERAER